MKVVLYHSVAPFAHEGGAPLLRSLIPEDRVSEIIWCYAAERDSQRIGTFSCKPAIIPSVGSELPRLLRSLLFKTGLRSFVEDYTLERATEKAAASLNNIITNEKPSHLWGVAHRELVLVLDAVSSTFKGHVHITVHDDPMHVLIKEGAGRKRKLRHLLDIAYPRLLRRANSIDVVSKGMAESLSAKYGVASLVLPPTPKFHVTVGLPPPPIKQGFRVLATGSGDCGNEFAALCDGLRLGEQHGLIQKPRIVYLCSSNSTVRQQDIDLFEFREFLPEAEAIELAQTCHLLYAPYRFDPKSEPLQSTSFPSKLSMYLPSCRPLLFHGPTTTSLARFHRDTGIGLSWTSLSPTDLLPFLAHAQKQLDDLTQLYRDTCSCVEKYFNQTINRSALWDQLQMREVIATC